MKTLIVTQPGMILPSDYEILNQFGEVVYIEKMHIDVDELANLAADSDYLMLNYDVAEPFDPSFYDKVKGTKLKGISCDITGMSWAHTDDAEKCGIKIMNTPNYCTESVAEQIVAQMFLHSKRIHASYCDVINGVTPKVRKGFDVKGKIFGIIGLGNIGNCVAGIAAGIGMNVIGWTYSNKKTPNVQMCTMDEVLSRSDILTICLKTSDDTIGMINAEFLSKCKSSCIIINQAGEQLVVHNDLYDALISSKLGGYSGTINDSIMNHQIYRLDNASFQPANAWFTEESLLNLRRIWVNNVLEMMNDV